MPKRFFLLPLLFLSTIGYSQIELRLNVSAKHQPQSFYFTNSRDMDGFKFLPILTISPGARVYLDYSKFFVEGDLSYSQTRYKQEADWVAPDGVSNDLFIPDGNEFQSVSHYAEISLGAGSVFKLTPKSKITLSTGGQFLYHFASRWLNRPYSRFRNDNFYFNNYYGLYLRPEYSFSFSKEDKPQWFFSLIADTDLLFRKGSDSNPIFLWGGGLGVSYRLN